MKGDQEIIKKIKRLESEVSHLKDESVIYNKTLKALYFFATDKLSYAINEIYEDHNELRLNKPH